ncbi:MAG: hypothetical protein LBD79_02550 [Treponema sp.]|nr:hypothetical protein [Treponema sp.]
MRGRAASLYGEERLPCTGNTAYPVLSGISKLSGAEYLSGRVKVRHKSRFVRGVTGRQSRRGGGWSEGEISRKRYGFTGGKRGQTVSKV